MLKIDEKLNYFRNLLVLFFFQLINDKILWVRGIGLYSIHL